MRSLDAVSTEVVEEKWRTNGYLSSAGNIVMKEVYEWGRKHFNISRVVMVVSVVAYSDSFRVVGMIVEVGTYH